MTGTPKFTICTYDGDPEVSRVSDRSWRVHFPGGERDDLIVSEQAVAVLTDPYVLTAVEAVLAYEAGCRSERKTAFKRRPE